MRHGRLHGRLPTTPLWRLGCPLEDLGCPELKGLQVEGQATSDWTGEEQKAEVQTGHSDVGEAGGGGQRGALVVRVGGARRGFKTFCLGMGCERQRGSSPEGMGEGTGR